jgi:hypothetical protein
VGKGECPDDSSLKKTRPQGALEYGSKLPHSKGKKEQRMEATQQSVQESAQPAGFEPEIVAFCCEF